MSETALREELALAYRILADLRLDDLTYTHLSARLPDSHYFFIYPFGLLFEEVTAASLLKVTLQGEVVEGSEYQYNQTGYVMHGCIYRNRADLNAIFHLHTKDGVAVSAMKEGLLPISQWALHFYDKVSYHDYNSLALTVAEHEKNLIDDLNKNKVMILRNHGTVTCGASIPEAFFYSYHLEKACQVQTCTLSSGGWIVPQPAICKQANVDLLAFEKNLGERDWQALKRKMHRKDSKI